MVKERVEEGNSFNKGGTVLEAGIKVIAPLPFLLGLNYFVVARFGNFVFGDHITQSITCF